MGNRRKTRLMRTPRKAVVRGADVMPGTFTIRLTDCNLLIGGEWVAMSIQANIGLGEVDIINSADEVIGWFKGLGQPVHEQEASFSPRLLEYLSESETAGLYEHARGVYGAISGLAAAGQLKGYA